MHFLPVHGCMHAGRDFTYCSTGFIACWKKQFTCKWFWLGDYFIFPKFNERQKMLREGLKRVLSVSTDAVLGAVAQKAAMRHIWAHDTSALVMSWLTPIYRKRWTKQKSVCRKVKRKNWKWRVKTPVEQMDDERQHDDLNCGICAWRLANIHVNRVDSIR